MSKRKTLTKFGSALLSLAAFAGTLPSASLPLIAADEDASSKEGSEQTGQQLNTNVTENKVQYIDTGERTVDFDPDWSFHLGDASGAEQPLFDDSEWQTVNVPHDYSISQEYDPTLEGESAYKPGGVAWYRKSFVLSEEAENKRIRIDFDGVYMNSTVYINGHKLGDHPYGYTPFSYDLTDYLNKEGENVLSVRVDHQIPSSRWYSGSGIHRDVKLTITDDVHVDLFGTQITTPRLEEQKDGVVDTLVATTLVNDGSEEKTVTVRQRVYKKGTDTLLTEQSSGPVALSAGQSQEVELTLGLSCPDLWSTTSPSLYVMETSVFAGEELVDTYTTQYGYRYFNFDNNTGFSLNGESMKLNGVCMHHDQGSLGSVDTRRAVERQVEIMKKMGVNSIRTSHNPASSAFLEICAEQGILVMEEMFDGWSNEKNGNTEDYSNYFNTPIAQDNEIINGDQASVWAQFDLQETLRRGRNNPAIIIWDLGNEIEHGNTSAFPQICDNLITWIQAMDDRPVVLGDNKTLGNATSTSNTIRDKIHAAGGLIGSNYGIASDLQTRFRNAHPDWRFTGTENVSSVNSRGIYDRMGSQQDVNGDRQLTSYDTSCVSWGHRASQAMIGFLENDWFAGEYVWTGFDYLGEPTPWNGISAGSDYGWPAPKNSYFGIVDTAGFEKDTYYFYRSMWKQDDTTLHILPAWRNDVVYKNSSNQVPVVVYTNAHKVRLDFTDTSGNTRTIGEKEFTEKTTANGYKWRIYEGADRDATRDKNLYLTWYVPYEDGTITATAYDVDGNIIEKTTGRSSVTTFGEAAALDANADRTEIRADGKDLTYIAVDVLDADGRFVANAANRVRFTVEGEGKLVGVDNGNSIDHQSFQDDNRQAFSGKVLAIVQSTGRAGTITVKAEADGLASDTVTIQTVDGIVPQENAPASIEYSQGCYLRAGTTPVLPETVRISFEDGTVQEDVPVEWEEVSADQLAQSGSVTVNGVAGGQKVSYYINVIDSVGAVQNYSAAVKKGSTITLPATRPVLRQDGTRLPIYAPVSWEAIDDELTSSEGVHIIHGTADVLGESYAVSASIAVKEETTSRSDNVVPTLGYRITQNIESSLQSDNLLAIKDGNAAPGDPSSGYNAKIWSNYNSTNAATPQRHAEITIYLDTAQNLSQASIYFCADEWSMVYPSAGDVKLEISETGDDGTWRELETVETIGDEITTSGVNTKSKCYSYTFDPVQATVVRVSFDTASGQTVNAKYATGISEIELYPVTASLQQSSSTALASLRINGKDEGFVNTQADTLRSEAYLIDSIEAIGAENASVTVLPVQDDIVRMVIESEDHSESRIVTVSIRKPYERDPQTADYDLPTTNLTASSPSVYPGTGNEGPVSYVLDNNSSTYYHSNWNNSSASDINNRHVDLTFDTPTQVAALRYLPRNSSGDGGRNGQITSYRIQYQETADGEWKDIAQGDWAYTPGWKAAEFDHPVTAKAIRLTGVHTVSNGSVTDEHMSAAELRLCTEFPKEDISQAAGFAIQWPDQLPDHIVEGELDLHKDITVTADDTLYYGTDYYFTYDFDKANNEVTVTLKGNAFYSGEVSRTYKVSEILSVDTSLLELTIAAGDSLMANADSYTGTDGLSSALSAGKAALQAKASQKAINDAASALNQALVGVRLIPSAEKLDNLR